MDSEESKSLLSDPEAGIAAELVNWDLHGKLKRQSIHIGLLYIVILTLVVVLGWIRLEGGSPELMVFSPMNDIIQYKPAVFYDNIEEISPYQGEPDDTKDTLWDLLYRDLSDTETTLIPASSATRLPNRTMVVPGSDGDGIVQFEVFHQLHCLNSLRKSLYPDRFPDYSVFFPNGTRNTNIARHHDHCIDRLRQGLMCASDVGTVYWRWNDYMQRWWINMETTHSCRNFDEIRQWAVDRNLPDWDESRPSRLTP